MSLHALPWVWCLLPVVSAWLCSLWVCWQARPWAPPFARKLLDRCLRGWGTTVLASMLLLLMDQPLSALPSCSGGGQQGLDGAVCGGVHVR